MDVNNDHLKALLEKTDKAFQALLKKPDSEELNCAYESAKNELNQYISAVRSNLAKRQR
ncbi:hypothetical protein [Alteromonas sp. 14N.309.X.WAT.G.H12]|uniref:hypothetical protein n=1 Tax=Alteromonas sp. 14N.309.X.WAT.G.H12 TaxID=3120824 RepID=UPI002FD224F9